MKVQDFTSIGTLLLSGFLLADTASYADDEICGTCGPRRAHQRHFCTS